MSDGARGPLARLAALAWSGVAAARLAPLRSLVTVACVAAGLVPYLAALGISRGLRDDAEAALAAAADLHVTGLRFGRFAPLPRAVCAEIEALPGVLSATPRVVGELSVGDDGLPVVVIGLPDGAAPAGLALARGRLPRSGGPLELVLGAALAERLHTDVGAYLPPFYHASTGERVAQVVGVLPADAPLWSAHVVLTSLDAACEMFDQRGLVTDVLVRVRPGYESEAKAALVRLPPPAPDDPHGPLRLRVVTRPELLAYLPRGVLAKEGAFGVHFLLAFALGIPLVLVASGLGLAERRRDAGLLRALGWGADDLLVRNLAESTLLCVAGAAIALLVAHVWLGLCGGAGIARVFVADADPSVALPYRLEPEAALVGCAVAFAVVMTGTLWSSWRAVSAPPREAMR